MRKMQAMELTTVAAYRENAQRTHESSLLFAQINGTGDEAQLQATHHLQMSLLADAWTYQVDIEEMRTHRRRSSMPPDNHLWIEFSQPLPCHRKREMKHFDEQMTEIAALWLSRPALYIPQWHLALIGTSGNVWDTLIYYMPARKWGLPPHTFWCHKCIPMADVSPEQALQAPSIKPCKMCNDYLNAWRNRLNEALSLIQCNAYRPGVISAPTSPARKDTQL